MSYNQMSADYQMYSGYMPPSPAHVSNQKHGPLHYSQQPIVQHQHQPQILNQQQQPQMLNQQHPQILNQQQQPQKFYQQQQQPQALNQQLQPQALNQQQPQRLYQQRQPQALNQQQQPHALNQQPHALNQQQQPHALNQQQQQQPQRIYQPQLPLMLNQQQPPVLNHHLSSHQYNTDPYNAPYGSLHPTKQLAMPTQIQAQDPPQAHQMQPWHTSQNKVLPVPLQSPNNISANPYPRSSPQQNIQQMIAMPQRRTSDASPIQQTPHSSPLSPMHRLTPQSAQMSPGQQQFSQTAPAPNPRTMNHVRLSSTSSAMASQQAFGQNHRAHYVLDQTHSLQNPTSPISPQASQGAFHASTLQPDSALLQASSRSSHYQAKDQSANHVERQSNSFHGQSSQNISFLNQIEQVGCRPETHQGNGQFFLHSSGPENILNMFPSPSSRMPSSGEFQDSKTAKVSNSHTSVDSRTKPHYPLPGVITGSNQTSFEQNSSSFHGSGQTAQDFSRSNEFGDCEKVDSQSPRRGRGSRGGRGSTGSRGARGGMPSPRRGRGSIEGRGSTGSRGARGGRGTVASRAKTRGAPRNRGQGRGRGAAPIENNPPQQTVPWSVPSHSATLSYQSDIEAMQAGWEADMVLSNQSSHPAEATRGTQSSNRQGATSPIALKSTSQTSAKAATTNLLTSPSRIAALETIRIKQEALENIGRAKIVNPVPQQLDHQSKGVTVMPENTKTAQSSNREVNIEANAVKEVSGNNQNVISNSKTASFFSSPHSQSAVTLPSQSTNSPRGKETTPDSSFLSNSHRRETQDSLAFLLNHTTSVEKKISQSQKVDSLSNQSEKTSQPHHQNSVPIIKTLSTTKEAKGNFKRNVSDVAKSNVRANSSSVGRLVGRQNSPATETISMKNQSMPPENKKPMTAKERVINMWRDGQVVGRTPTLLKRSAKINDRPQIAAKIWEPPNESHYRANSSESAALHISKNSQGPSLKKLKQEMPREESNRSKLDLYHIMFHGHKLICLNSTRERMLLLCQFQFDCFPDKGMGSVNNCIDRSLRIKKKPLQHRLQSDIVSYLKNNDYKIDSEVLTINLEDARRVYHHLYNIRNCVSASCVVSLFDQPVDLSHFVPGSRKRTFQREILGRIKTEMNSTVESNPGEPMHGADQGESAANLGPQQTSNVGDEDARSDCTVAYPAEKAADDEEDDIMIVGVEENPNMICYNSEGPMVGMLCNSLMGSVRSYKHNEVHYLVIEDLSKMFGSSVFNSLLENQNITVYSCCTKIGAFLNQISDKFPAVTSFNDCLVKEKDIGVQWANNQPEPESSANVSKGQTSLKQEIIEDLSSCSPSKQPRLSASTSTPHKKTSSESELNSSEPRLQIDLGDISQGNKEKSSGKDCASSTDVGPSTFLSEKRGNLNAEPNRTLSSVSVSPESHCSTETLGSTYVLNDGASKNHEDDSQRNQALIVATSHKEARKEQEKKDLEVLVLDITQKELRNSAGSTCPASSSESSLTTSQQDKNSSNSFLTDSSQVAESSFENNNKTKTYAELCQMNKTLQGIVHKLRKELADVKQDLAKTTAAKEKAEKVAKHYEDALATITSSFPLGNSSAPIVIDEEEPRS